MITTQATRSDATRDARRAEVRRLRHDGHSNREIARRIGVSEAAVRRDIKALDAAGAPANATQPTHPADAPPATRATHTPTHPTTLDLLRHIAGQLRDLPADALDTTHATHHQARAIAVHAARLLAAAPPRDDAERDALRQIADALADIADDAPDAGSPTP